MVITSRHNPLSSCNAETCEDAVFLGRVAERRSPDVANFSSLKVGSHYRGQWRVNQIRRQTKWHLCPWSRSSGIGQKLYSRFR
jgi:hypothetical protein